MSGTCGWLGSVAGHQTIPLGGEPFSQTVTIGECYRHFGIDTGLIMRALSG